MLRLDKFERYPLTFGPTPIEKLPRLTAHLGGKVEIFAKRDDCNSGLAFGGNKLRKLEYIVPDAIASGADTLVSIGGVQSNHTRHGRGDGGQDRHEVPAGPGKLGAARGRRLRPRRQHPDEPRDGRRDRARRRGLRHRHPRELGAAPSTTSRRRAASPMRIPAGASVHQVRRAGLCRLCRGGAGSRRRSSASASTTSSSAPSPARPMPAWSSASRPTAAQRNVIGIDASCTPDEDPGAGARHRATTRPIWSARPGRSRTRSSCYEDYAYPVYGVPSDETNEAIRLCGAARRHDHRPGLRG